MSKWRNSSINDIYTSFSSFPVCSSCKTTCEMAMQVDWQFTKTFFKCRNHFISVFWCHQTGHIFNAKRICTHFNQFFSNFQEAFSCMYWGDCVYHCGLNMCASFFRIFNSSFHVTRVIQCIENTNAVDTITNSSFTECFNYIIRVMFVAQ